MPDKKGKIKELTAKKQYYEKQAEKYRLLIIKELKKMKLL